MFGNLKLELKVRRLRLSLAVAGVLYASNRVTRDSDLTFLLTTYFHLNSTKQSL